MPSKIDQGTIIILDVGNNTSISDEKEEKCFFKKARECVCCLIERKIISQGKNYLGIVLLGTNTTKNNLAKQCRGLYKHIEVVSELSTPTWKMIRDIPENPSIKTGDWFDALVVAVDHFQSQSDIKFVARKIILMSNFQSPTCATSENIDQVLQGLKEDNYEVDVIGLDLYDDNLKGKDIELARQLVDVTDGATENFENTLLYLSFHRKRTPNPVPWNVDLKIGPNISIPVSAFIRLEDKPVIKKWNTAVKNTDTGKASTTEAVMKPMKVYKDSQNANVEEKDIIKGYRYGQSVIPLSDADKSMLYVSGQKCLSVYGFTHKTNISWQCLNGDSLSYVFGRKGDKKAQLAIRCLVECMRQLDLVAIVRRVYNNNYAPKMFAVFPVIDSDNYICLSMAAICYKEDIKYMSFPSTNLKKHACTDEQVNAFKDLIKAMDLTRAYDETYDDTEAFPIARTVSPFAQFVLDCIAFRAMNPDKPLAPPREEIINLFKVPPEVAERSQKPLEKIKSLFVLNKIEKKVSKKKSNITDDAPIDSSRKFLPHDAYVQMSNMDLSQESTTNEDRDRIGTLDPIGDYTQFKNNGKTMADLAPEMAKAIEDLIYCNLDGNYIKAFGVMTFFRNECDSQDPLYYNNWLKTFKTELNNLKKSDVLNLIRERNVNFITKLENNLSTYETEYTQDDSEMYDKDTIPNSGQLSISTDIHDLFEDF